MFMLELNKKSEQTVDNDSQGFSVLGKEFINKEEGKPKINPMLLNQDQKQ